MSTDEPTALGDKLSATDDPTERRRIAADALHKSLDEAHRHAKTVADHENARTDTHEPLATDASKTVELLDPVLGMWRS